MGLPAGWVTAVPGVPRNAQLKALGNGVVPQQAALALAMLGVGQRVAVLSQVGPSLPTPRAVVVDRTSRRAALLRHTRSGPSLGQAVEIAQGQLPPEFDTWEELPPSWRLGRSRGARMASPVKGEAPERGNAAEASDHPRSLQTRQEG